MNGSMIEWLLWGIALVFSCFISIHSSVTPTPEKEEEFLSTHPNVRGVYPWHDQYLSRVELLRLGTKYAKRLRLAGRIGLVLTVAIAICTFLPSRSLPISDSSRKAISGLSFIIVLGTLRIVEKRTWPFTSEKDRGELR